MDEREAFQLLTLASARDGRNVTQATAQVWAADLADISIRDAVEAVSLHYRESSDWLMPVHVRRGARRIIAERERDARLASRRGITIAELRAQRDAIHAQMRAEGAPLLEVEA